MSHGSRSAFRQSLMAGVGFLVVACGRVKADSSANFAAAEAHSSDSAILLGKPAAEDETTRRVFLQTKFERALDAFQKEPIDPAWAHSAAQIVQRALDAHVRDTDGMQHGDVECRYRTCSVEFALAGTSSHGFAALSREISIHVLKDIRAEKMGSVSLEFLLRPRTDVELVLGRYYWRFRRTS